MLYIKQQIYFLFNISSMLLHIDLKRLNFFSCFYQYTLGLCRGLQIEKNFYGQGFILNLTMNHLLDIYRKCL